MAANLHFRGQAFGNIRPLEPLPQEARLGIWCCWLTLAGDSRGSICDDQVLCEDQVFVSGGANPKASGLTFGVCLPRGGGIVYIFTRQAS